MSLCKEPTESFEKLAVNHPNDTYLTFSIQTLGTNVWPLKSLEMTFMIPKEITPTYNHLQQLLPAEALWTSVHAALGLQQERVKDELRDLEIHPHDERVLDGRACAV